MEFSVFHITEEFSSVIVSSKSVFENSEQSECLPIMVAIRGVCHWPTVPSTLLETRYIQSSLGSREDKANLRVTDVIICRKSSIERRKPRWNDCTPVYVFLGWTIVSFFSYLKRVKGYGGCYCYERFIQPGVCCALPKAKGSNKKKT